MTSMGGSGAIFCSLVPNFLSAPVMVHVTQNTQSCCCHPAGCPANDKQGNLQSHNMFYVPATPYDDQQREYESEANPHQSV